MPRRRDDDGQTTAAFMRHHSQLVFYSFTGTLPVGREIQGERVYRYSVGDIVRLPNPAFETKVAPLSLPVLLGGRNVPSNARSAPARLQPL
jgi:hypothetical protein